MLTFQFDGYKPIIIVSFKLKVFESKCCFQWNKFIISCSTCCPSDRVRATWVGASFKYCS